MDLNNDSANHKERVTQVGPTPPQLPFGIDRSSCIFLVILVCLSFWVSGSRFGWLSINTLFMLFIALAGIVLAIFTKYVVPLDFNKARGMRYELPQFIDCLADLVESGVSVPAALENAANTCASSCPNLSREVGKAVQTFKLTGTPLYKSIAEIGSVNHTDDLNNLAGVLAVSDISGSSLAVQLRRESDLLKYRLKGESLAPTVSSTRFGYRPVYNPEKFSPRTTDKLNKDEDGYQS